MHSPYSLLPLPSSGGDVLQLGTRHLPSRSQGAPVPGPTAEGGTSNVLVRVDNDDRGRRVGAVATFMPDRWDRWVQWAITFAFVYAMLYFAVHYVALFIYDQATVELEILKHSATSATGALVMALIACIFFPARWTQRVWSGWTGVIPLSVMLVFAFLLRGWFMPSVGIILR